MSDSTAIAVSRRNIVPTRATGLPDALEWRTLLEMADVLVKSGLLPDAIKTPQAAVVVMQKGRELGIPPLYAVNNIAVIKGKATASAELMLALIYRDHGDDSIRFTEATATRATVTYKRRSWTERQSFSFSMQDAQTAGLAGSDTWKKYPAALLRARSISAVARMAFPDSIGGMYTPEELGATVRANDQDEVEIVQGPAAASNGNGHAQPTSVDHATGEIVGPAVAIPETPKQKPKITLEKACELYEQRASTGRDLFLDVTTLDPTWTLGRVIAEGKDLSERIRVELAREETVAEEVQS